MTIDIYLSVMKLKETDTYRILGYYQNNGEWNKVQGNTPEEFVDKIKQTINLRNQNIILHKDQIKYFENLIPIPKPVDEKTYAEIRKLTEKTTYQPLFHHKSA